ncbi:MAG: hypothetical protein JRJ85_22550, partial [Deltaproteobacteria bacterium]|nr:hypothetical protein [Deltaproteobacteria bacterium]
RITCKNAFPATGSLRYGGTPYYTTTATYAGQTNLASVATTIAGSMAAYTYQIEEWGILHADVFREFNITPVTVTEETHYQPTLRFTLGNRFELKGVAGDPASFHFAHTAPEFTIVE